MEVRVRYWTGKEVGTEMGKRMPEKVWSSLSEVWREVVRWGASYVAVVGCG